MKNFVLNDPLNKTQWAGVMIIAVAIAIVGYSSTMGGKAPEAEGRMLSTLAGDAKNPVFGMAVTGFGTLMQSFQYVYEEKVMADMDCPPLLLIGTEGAFGFVLCGLVLYPLAYALPGSDHGCYENPFNTFHKVTNDGTLLFYIVCYTALIFVLNSLSIVITYMLSSVWHIRETSRTPHLRTRATHARDVQTIGTPSSTTSGPSSCGSLRSSSFT